MYNFRINFSSPWWLLLLIPAIAITLIPYFRLSKKYRRTRNRISSMILHLVATFLAVFVLSGMTFNYQKLNDQNEIILLIDVSDTTKQAEEEREDFIRFVLDSSQYDGFNVGVVTFGFDQNYAVPLTNKVNDIYDLYMDADLPDVSATDIAAALTYTKDLFNYPETGKIVLVTDGKETDESALSVIRSVTASGITVDVVDLSSDYNGSDVKVVGMVMPDYHVNKNESCTLGVTLYSVVDVSGVTVRLSDNGVQSETAVQIVDLMAGEQVINLPHTFTENGLHELTVKLDFDDGIRENNEYTSYYYLDVFENVLILERADGESEAIVSLLESNEYKATVINITSAILTDLPKTVEEYRKYDQIILNNISNVDLSVCDGTLFALAAEVDPGLTKEDYKDFTISLLYSYVYDYGGGLLTVGGNNELGEANTYVRADLYNTLYQQMLPVQAIEYTPPVGVMIIIDRSGSMSSASTDGATLLEWAKTGAASCLKALTERDYMGIMTLDSTHETILPLTPCTQQSKILNAINSIQEASGATVFPGAINRAGQALIALTNVSRRHIIIVSDGEVPAGEREAYLDYIDSYYKSAGITVSVVGIGMKPGTAAAELMQEAVNMGHGRLHMVSSSDMTALVTEMREDLMVDDIKEINYEEFYPTIFNVMSPLVTGIELGGEDGTKKNQMTVTLGGFYGTKVRANADLILSGDYDVPLYAQWKFGKGMVGSFTCDLKGTTGSWSVEFLADVGGQTIIKNIVANLMPTESIRPSEIKMVLKEENYINRLSIYANLNEGEYIVGEISGDNGSVEKISLNELLSEETDYSQLVYYTTSPLTAANNYSRCTFVVKESGTYLITVKKYDAEGNLLATQEMYKSFAYSKEYANESDVQLNTQENLEAIAKRGDGNYIGNSDDYERVFENFVIDLDKSFDPRALFMIIAIVAILLDIAARKFKFKWLHEIIAEKKNKNKKK